MTREEVHSKCFRPVPEFGEHIMQEILPREAIDAIIDCAVEEAVQRIGQMTFAKIDGMTGIPIEKAHYVEAVLALKGGAE